MVVRANFALPCGVSRESALPWPYWIAIAASSVKSFGRYRRTNRVEIRLTIAFPAGPNESARSAIDKSLVDCGLASAPGTPVADVLWVWAFDKHLEF